ncbi:MAG: acyloxyacyl hydrolase [Bacteroidetes bacterium]|nr:acyloxyacyl hydrolase [Bacteroidota bacterium]
MQNQMRHVFGVEIGRQWRIDSGGNIDRRQHHPVAGTGLVFFNLGSSVNGHGYAWNGFYEAGIPLGSKTSLRFRLSVGIGYLDKQFELNNNRWNRAIGSHVNGFMQALGYFESPLGKRVDMQLGLGLSHYSNGNWGQPNLGINLPGLVLGLKYKDKGTRYTPTRAPLENKMAWEFSFRAGKRQMSIDDPRNIVNYLVDAVWSYPHNEIRRWRGGINVFYDRTYLFEKFQPMPKATLGRVTEIAITGGHEYKFNKLGLVTDLGVYIYRPDSRKRMYYEAIGLRYYATKNLIFFNRLKAHLTSADYFEWGITWQIHGKNETKPGFVNAFRSFVSFFQPVE